MPKIPYIAPKLYNKTIFSVRLPASQAPDTRQIVPVWLAKAAPANASEIMLLSARPAI